MHIWTKNKCGNGEFIAQAPRAKATKAERNNCGKRPYEEVIVEEHTNLEKSVKW